MIDLVTVVFKDELPVLKLQAASIARYCRNIGIKNIYVLVNDSNDVVRLIDTKWWGELSSCVSVIPRSMFSTEFVDNGWVSQQILKLLGATLSYNTWSMVLDAKTIFVRDVDLQEVLDDSGRVRVGTLGTQTVFEHSRLIINNLYGIDLQQQLGPGGVPFFFRNDMVRAMISDTTKIVRESFPWWFQSQGRLTEFMLYSGYLLYSLGSYDKFYNPHPGFAVVNVCHSEVGRWEPKLQEMQQPKTLTVSVHRNAWSQLTEQQQQQYRDLLIQRNISGADIL